MQFLQTSQKKFRLVELRAKVHLCGDVIDGLRQVSGTCARKEGLRTLTSPRREASLFKLGRNFGSGHFLVCNRVSITLLLTEIFARIPISAERSNPTG